MVSTAVNEILAKIFEALNEMEKNPDKEYKRLPATKENAVFILYLNDLAKLILDATYDGSFDRTMIRYVLEQRERQNLRDNNPYAFRVLAGLLRDKNFFNHLKATLKKYF